MNEASPSSTQSRTHEFLNGLLVAMVAIYSILTAVMAFSTARAEGLSSDNAFIFLSHLTDSVDLSLGAHALFEHDLRLFEQIQVHQISGSDPEIIEFLEGQYSPEAQANLERSDWPDQTYWEEIFFHHNVERDLAMRSIGLAAAWSERSSTYQTVVTLLAVGMAFTAWASLMERAGRIRWLFTAVAGLILIGCLGFLSVHLVAREPLEEYHTFTGYENYIFLDE